MTSKRAAIALAAIAMTGLNFLGPDSTSPAHASDICYKVATSHGYNRVTGSGGGILKSKAKYRARRDWGDSAQRAMGSSRARTWSHARHKEYSCYRAGFWYCTVYAQPCM